MAYRLPPLNSLRLFEAAGRHLSFKAAAGELNVTPSAVSHGIQTLEDWLGVTLFARGHRSLILTGAGAYYLPRIRDILETLARATEGVPGRHPSGRLTVSTTPTFALRWLMPRLPGFNARHPEIEVTLDTAHRRMEFPRDGIDVAIRLGDGQWPDLYATCLVVEDLVPVCAPALAAGIRSASDLAGQTLLHVVSIAEDWEAWARLAGVGGLDLHRGLRFDTIQMALEAAARGLGIAMGHLPLADEDLAGGRLVPVLGPPRRGRMGYWLVAGRDSLSRPEVAAFRTWVRGEMKAAPQRPA
ncbi:transcriptional regulator GcvA [Zavarzinia compransoris]|uniref:LysR family transcriptional regulator n=1 Tax=Zavarzinia compransoris TaxID=1264899 RepID=A0A317E8Y5_9PROT|nr:transcriptional regulator GcvA [Zavarzinia compransoris]PWR23191.1 LysR family transcriptional regulator [Zavarzinia compransoris]TDP46251.1 DNA-binding transcriptional LysR family regulator [Zavarzinia compransoris]